MDLQGLIYILQYNCSVAQNNNHHSLSGSSGIRMGAPMKQLYFSLGGLLSVLLRSIT